MHILIQSIKQVLDKFSPKNKKDLDVILTVSLHTSEKIMKATTIIELNGGS